MGVISIEMVGDIEFRDDLTEGRSERVKRSRLSTEPWGTPKERVWASEKWSPILIFFVCG